MKNYSYSDLLGNHSNGAELLVELNLDLNDDNEAVQDKMITVFKSLDYYDDLRNEILREFELENDDFNDDLQYYNERAESEIREIFFKCALELLAQCHQRHEAFKFLRFKAHKTQKESAELVHVNSRSWQYWEAGQREIPLAVVELFCIKNKIDFKLYKKYFHA